MAAKRPLEYDVVGDCFVVKSRFVDKDGYSSIRVDRQRFRVHRFVYEQMFGDIPDGMVVRHRCDNPACINPEHLEIGTNQDNMDDMAMRGRRPSKLTADQALQIKQDPRTYTEIARDYGLSDVHVRRIKLNHNWRN